MAARMWTTDHRPVIASGRWAWIDRLPTATRVPDPSPPEPPPPAPEPPTPEPAPSPPPPMARVRRAA